MSEIWVNTALRTRYDADGRKLPRVGRIVFDYGTMGDVLAEEELPNFMEAFGCYPKNHRVRACWKSPWRRLAGCVRNLCC